MDETSLTILRRFRAPPEAVFEACTDPAKLRRWFGPADFTVTTLEAEARVGGRLSFRMEGPNGSVAAEGTFREVVAPRRVALSWRWTEGPPGDPPLHVGSLVTFDIAPDGAGSRLTLTHEGYRDGPRGQDPRGGLVRGGGQARAPAGRLGGPAWPSSSSRPPCRSTASSRARAATSTGSSWTSRSTPP